jgi:peptidyl-prolyl cis-trans isomerase A (cyclophilin A)
MTSRSFAMRLLPAALAAAAFLLSSCSAPAPKKAEERAETAEPAKPPEPPSAEPAKPAEPPKEEAKKVEPEKPAKKDLTKPALFTEKAPDTFKVRFETSKGNFVVEVHRAWAPRGADRFYNLVKYGFFDQNRFFRIVPNFIVQWGIPGDPKVARAWENAAIKDDPVARSNTKGYITFATAGPNTRTTQLFINLKTNSFLDDQGFAPFGNVVEGMNVVESLFAGYGERPDQGRITAQGNAYLQQQFPNLDYIKRTVIL